MTREEAKELLPIIKAFAEGKAIQFRIGDNKWRDMDKPFFGECPSNYRIKPEPKYRPFKNREECWNEMLKHQSCGWVKNDVGDIFNIIVMFNNNIKINECWLKYLELFERFKFIDGTPFGIKEDN